jgi:adenine-specific DNA-methyltransferase
MRAPGMHRRLIDLRRLAARLEASPMSPLQLCEAVIEGRLADREALTFFSGLEDDERHYWIASLYALLMPEQERRARAAYFTPPYLARYAIDAIVDAGITPGKHHILDPASGGAAFLVPLAQRIAANGRRSGKPASAVLQSIATTLHGIEIDAGLAALSRSLLEDLLQQELASTGGTIANLILRADMLRRDAPVRLYDAAIGNPP